tara:strand:- start:10750 stop:11598 length:849 start_codon:yes stop_codon:yes gene_type:complete
MSKNLNLCTQILFKKYEADYPWLTFNNLQRLIMKFNKDPLFDIFEGDLDVHIVKEVHTKVFPVIQNINNVKSLRALDYTPDPVDEKITKTPIEDHIKPIYDYKIHYVLLDSKDRFIDNWPTSNPFQFTLGPSSLNLLSTDTQNNIDRSFPDVFALTVKKIIIPTITPSYPYLLLTINELGPNINGTNNDMNNSFGHLTEPQVYGDYTHYIFTENYESIIENGQTTHMTKLFSPRIEITKLTFHIKAPDGSTIVFDADKSVVIELQIVCLRKKLDNTMLLRPA